MADRIWKKEAPIDATDPVVFDLPEAGYMTRVGEPMLMQEGIFVEIPPNAVFENIEVSSDGGRVLKDRKIEGIDSKTGLPFTRLKSGCVGVDRS